MTLKDILKKAWKKHTEEREIIFSAVKNLHHFDYSKLQNYLKEENIKIWRASIFRTLNLFLENWVLKNVCNKWWTIIYEYIDQKNHHEHLKCKKCWKIIEFDDSKIHKYLEEIAKKYDFVLLDHSINLEGLCGECRE